MRTDGLLLQRTAAVPQEQTISIFETQNLPEREYRQAIGIDWLKINPVIFLLEN